MSNSGTLKVTLPNDLEIVMTRVFHAPRKLVFEAMSKPELIRKWLYGPPGWEMTTCVEDARVGGSYHWAWKSPDGQTMEMRGVYREVDPPARIVRTEAFTVGDAPLGEQLATLDLADQGDKTTLTLRLQYSSKEARDGALASGMEKGVAASYDRLDALLAL